MNTVNLFFACDDSYVPFLAVTLTSIRENCDPSRDYAIRILQTGIQEESKQRLTRLVASDHFTVEFVDMGAVIENVSDQLHTRDYYSKSTYYRLFIPELFPQLDKALYLDCDLVLLTDVSRLFDIPLGKNLVGAVPDGAVATIKPFRKYVKKRLKVQPDQYFNAGVLLMNLKEMRACNFTEIFLRLLESVTFQVAQDQDYLNVICRKRTRLLDGGWNTMPYGPQQDDPMLIHYNLNSKPWWQPDVLHGEYFWDYAERSGYLDEITAIANDFTQEQLRCSEKQTLRLIRLGQRQARRKTQNLRIHWKIRQVVDL